MKHRNVIVSIVSGVLITAVVLFFLTGISAKILISGRVGEGSARWLVLTSLIITSTIGCVIPALLRKNETAIPILITIANLVLVTCCSLILDGPFQSAWETLLAIVFGGAIACVTCMIKPAKNKKLKKHYR